MKPERTGALCELDRDGFACGPACDFRLKRDYVLLWQTVIGPDVAGDPVLVENQVVMRAAEWLAARSSRSMRRPALRYGVTPRNAMLRR
jgi:hypothetical protein